MKKFTISIQETLLKHFEIEAETKEQAQQIAIENYKNSEEGYVLSSDDWIETQFCMSGEDIECNPFKVY